MLPSKMLYRIDQPNVDVVVLQAVLSCPAKGETKNSVSGVPDEDRSKILVLLLMILILALVKVLAVEAVVEVGVVAEGEEVEGGEVALGVEAEVGEALKD